MASVERRIRRGLRYKRVAMHPADIAERERRAQEGAIIIHGGPPRDLYVADLNDIVGPSVTLDPVTFEPIEYDPSDGSVKGVRGPE